MAEQRDPDPIRQAFLTAFPNPNRVGCPGESVIRALVHDQLPVDHPASRHLGECSPCLKEFLELQADWKRKQRNRVLLASAALVVLAMFLGWFWKKHIYLSHREVASNHVPTIVDLSGDSNRGSSKVLTPPVVSHSTHDVTFIVKLRNEPGDYEIELRRASDNQLVLRFPGTVSTDQAGRKILRAQVNFSQVSPGSYLLLWQPRGSTTKEVAELVVQ